MFSELPILQGEYWKGDGDELLTGIKALDTGVADWRRVDSSIEPVQALFWLFYIYLSHGLISFVELLRDG
jgi:hypothetical protein